MPTQQCNFNVQQPYYSNYYTKLHSARLHSASCLLLRQDASYQERQGGIRSQITAAQVLTCVNEDSPGCMATNDRHMTKLSPTLSRKVYRHNQVGENQGLEQTFGLFPSTTCCRHMLSPNSHKHKHKTTRNGYTSTKWLEMAAQAQKARTFRLIRSSLKQKRKRKI